MADVQAMRQQFFAGKRADIDRNANVAKQQSQDALQRRFTSMGQGGSGAAISANMKANEGVEAQKQAALNDVGGMELQAAEGDLNRDFTATESRLGREFQSGMADKDMTFKRGLFDIEQGNKLKELDLAERHYGLEKDAQDFNKRMAEAEANAKDPGMLEGLLGENSVATSVVDSGLSSATIGLSDLAQGKKMGSGVANAMKQVGVGGGK